jgi:ATP-binding cassette subfamily B (MDR/TAP) protein 1
MDYMDLLLMVMGTIGAFSYAASVPLLHLLNGRVINDVYGNTENLQKRINDVCIIYCYVGIGAVVGGFIQVSCWTYAGERRSQRLQDKYLRAILSQEISWFDKIGGHELGSKVRDVVDNVKGNYFTDFFPIIISYYYV